MTIQNQKKVPVTGFTQNQRQQDLARLKTKYEQKGYSFSHFEEAGFTGSYALFAFPIGGEKWHVKYRGWLWAGLVVFLIIIWPKSESPQVVAENTTAAAPTLKSSSTSSLSSSTTFEAKAEAKQEEAEAEILTGSQNNAVRSAKQYLSITGFSRNGLIQQLSSDAGDGYNVTDATIAVDSLNVDWSQEAVRSAKQYLSITGFSCKGLIQQLSSSAGDKYTVKQATYGAQQAGACE